MTCCNLIYSHKIGISSDICSHLLRFRYDLALVYPKKVALLIEKRLQLSIQVAHHLQYFWFVKTH